MSIVQFLRIFWARRLFILAATVSCVIGAVIVILVMPARWQAHSRAMLNLLKPDPVTGLMVGGPTPRPMPTPRSSSSRTMPSPVRSPTKWVGCRIRALIAAYRRRSHNDTRDFRRWLAQSVIDKTKAEILEGSKSCEITYTDAKSPRRQDRGRRPAHRLPQRQPGLRRDDALRNAEWFNTQADKAKDAFDAAVAARTDYEKANGTIMADDKTDIDSAHLQALASKAESRRR